MNDARAPTRITVRGRLEPQWVEDLAGLEARVDHGPEGTITHLVGDLPDQAALQGVLSRLFALGLELRSVDAGSAASPSPEDDRD
jgi:hypothetical protein